MGVAGGEDPPRGEDEPPPLLGPRRRIALGAFFGVLYAISFIARGSVAPGIVGGILGGAVVYLVLKEADEWRKRRWRANRPRPRP